MWPIWIISFINLLTDRISRTTFSINPMVAISENILVAMDLVQFILQVHRHGVIVSKSPVISIFVVNIQIVKAVVNNLHKDHNVLATGTEDVVIALLVFSVNSYSPFFASNRLRPLLSLLMLFYTVTKADISFVFNPTYIIQPKPLSQGETNSQWPYNYIVHCARVVCKANIAN